MIFLSFLMSFFCPHYKVKYRLNFIANLMDNLFAHVFLGGHLFFFGLFDSDFWEFFKFFLQIGMILIPLRVVFIILVPFHLEIFLGKTFYFLENLFLFGICNFANRCNYYAIFRTNLQNIF